MAECDNTKISFGTIRLLTSEFSRETSVHNINFVWRDMLLVNGGPGEKKERTKKTIHNGNSWTGIFKMFSKKK